MRSVKPGQRVIGSLFASDNACPSANTATSPHAKTRNSLVGRGPLAQRYAGADAGNPAEDERRAIKVLLCPGEDLQGDTFDEVVEVITPLDAPDFLDIRGDNLPLSVASSRS